MIQRHYDGPIFATHLAVSETKTSTRSVHSYELVCGAVVQLGMPAAADEEQFFCPRHHKWEPVVPHSQAKIRRGPVRVHPTRRPAQKLTEEVVREVRRLHANGFNQTEIGRKLDVSRSTVYGIVNRITWKGLE